MKKLPTQKYRMTFRAAVLCAVLVGLLISCGEGIRLFPFPASESSTASDFFQSPENEIAYQFNAHRFEDFGQGNQNAKSQPDDLHHFPVGNSNLFNSFFLRPIPNSEGAHFAVSTAFKPPLFSESGESRAPPLTA